MNRLLGLVAVVIFAGGLLAVPAPAQQTVKIGSTPSFIFLPVYAAAELGFFKAEGIKADFVDFEGGAEVTTAMVGGSIEIERILKLGSGWGRKSSPRWTWL